jgi:hypothetical protein
MSNPYNNSKNLAKAQRKATKYHKGLKVKPSTRKNKKLDFFLDGKKVGTAGDSRYTDFILSGDKERRKRYRARHAKDLKKSGKFTNGKLAYYILW